MDERLRQEREAAYLQELSTIRKQLDAIGSLDAPGSILASREDIISTRSGNAIYRFDAEDNRWGWYTPNTKQINYVGFESVSHIPLIGTNVAVWPGNLIQGKSIASGNLTPVSIAAKRSPGRIVLVEMSGQAMSYLRDVAHFTNTNVNQAINDILKYHSGVFPANFTYTQNVVHSLEQMAYYLNMTTKEFADNTGGVFNDVQWAQPKTRVMVALHLTLFVIAYEFGGLGAVFNDQIQWSDLAPYTGEDNPVCYISSVSYGRYFVLLYETDAPQRQIQGAIDKAFNDENAETITQGDMQLFRNANMRMVMVGGNVQNVLEVIAGNPEAIRRFVTADTDNDVWVPVKYTLNYLHNSDPVSTYKEIDVNYTRIEHVREDKKNDVVININAIRSAALVRTGGSLKNISGDSHYSVSNISIQLIDGDKTEKTWTLNPNIHRAGTKDGSVRYYSGSFRIGELGAQNHKRIRIRFDVEYYAKRRGGFLNLETSGQTKTYPKIAEFSFDERSRRWVVTHSDDYQDRRLNFRSMNIRDNFNHVDINFNLDYSFVVDGERY
jgi:hypothetical protein